MTILPTQTAMLTALGLLMAAPAAAQSAECPASEYTTDANGDGMISADEAKSAAEREFARLDLNKDQQVERDEFVRCFTQAASEMQTEGSEAARDTVTFKRTDTNVDGKISRDEYGLGAQQAHQQQAQDQSEQSGDAGKSAQSGETDQQASDTSSGQQASGDQSASFAGVRGQDGIPANAEQIAEHTAQMFAVLDTNRDYVLTEEEWTAPADTSGMEERAAQIFDKIDLDRSGHVVPKEYVTALISAHQNAVEAARGNIAASPSVTHSGGVATEGESGMGEQARSEPQGGQDDAASGQAAASSTSDPAMTGAAAQAEIAASASGAQTADQVQVTIPKEKPGQSGSDEQVSTSSEELSSGQGAQQDGAPIFVYRIYRY